MDDLSIALYEFCDVLADVLELWKRLGYDIDELPASNVSEAWWEITGIAIAINE